MTRKILLLIMVTLVLAACGLKDAPVPPKAQAPPAVSDLAATVEGDSVLLRWTVPKVAQAGAFGKGRAVLSRAGTSLADAPCRECPLLFQRVADIPISGAEAMTYSEKLPRGFKYTYRIVMTFERAGNSPSSNAAVIEY